jgi:hypothetical protein
MAKDKKPTDSSDSLEKLLARVEEIGAQMRETWRPASGRDELHAELEKVKEKINKVMETNETDS